MLASKPVVTAKRVIPSDQALDIEGYDLFGDIRSRQSHLTLLNSCHKELVTHIEHQLIRLFNDHECYLEMSLFTAQAIAIEQNNLIWLKASNALNEEVVLAINYASLYRLAEIFLGGQHSGISKEISENKLSDSELRLLCTLFSMFLNNIDELLALKNQWQITPIDKPENKEEQLTSSCCINIKKFQATMDIWYQPSIVATQPTEDKKDINQELLDAQLTYAAEKIPTQLNIILAQTRLTLAELAQLQKDDLMLIDLPEIVTAYAGKQKVAQGRVVEKSGKLVMQVTDIK